MRRLSMATVILKPDREESLKRRHPWIFSGAIERVEGAVQPGDTVDVCDHSGRFWARGALSTASQIAVRIWTFDRQESIDWDFFRDRLTRAIQARDFSAGDAVRLVYGESDGLPGIIIDRYADYLVGQFLSAGAEVWRETIVELLNELLPCKGIYERSDSAVRLKEGLQERTGLLRGEEPPPRVRVKSGPYLYWADIREGHKTGFYLDQRQNRQKLSAYVPDREVLDCFGYTGGFTVAALSAGARHVTYLDSSAVAAELARQNCILNGLDDGSVEFQEGNAFDVLRRFVDEGRRFDVIILDPPKFAGSKSDLKRAGRAYKDINLQACKLLEKGGILATFSCSQHVTPDLFQKILSYAALDAGREIQILEWLQQASDHPVSLFFPESHYLKGLICRVW